MKQFLALAAVGVSLTALLPAAALAQASGDAAPAADEAEPIAGQEIIVTGTSRSRAALDTPLAISQLDDTALARAGVTSQADILNTIPSIKADGGGGEVAAFASNLIALDRGQHARRLFAAHHADAGIGPHPQEAR
mgnify:CR=1 FL=1